MPVRIQRNKRTKVRLGKRTRSLFFTPETLMRKKNQKHFMNQKGRGSYAKSRVPASKKHVHITPSPENRTGTITQRKCRCFFLFDHAPNLSNNIDILVQMNHEVLMLRQKVNIDSVKWRTHIMDKFHEGRKDDQDLCLKFSAFLIRKERHSSQRQRFNKKHISSRIHQYSIRWFARFPLLNTNRFRRIPKHRLRLSQRRRHHRVYWADM